MSALDSAHPGADQVIPRRGVDTDATRRQMLITAPALLAGAGTLLTGGDAVSSPAAGDNDLVALCEEFHLLQAEFARLNLVADRWPADDPSGQAEAEAAADAASDRQHQIMGAIASRGAVTQVGLRAKALAVGIFFEWGKPFDRESDAMLWSLVRDASKLSTT